MINQYCNGSVLILLLLLLATPQHKGGLGLRAAESGVAFFVFGSTAFVFQVYAIPLPLALRLVSESLRSGAYPFSPIPVSQWFFAKKVLSILGVIRVYSYVGCLSMAIGAAEGKCAAHC
jgi:hypothetical protein